MKFLKDRLVYTLVTGVLILNAVLAVVSPVSAATTRSLNGYILLQVQERGQAWYVNPLNGKRYFLGRPDDALGLMKSLGLGVSNKNLASFSLSAPRYLAGRILLKVEDKGQAYYLDPRDLKLYYLGRPIEALGVIRQRGLGISNQDLAKILVASAPAPLVSQDKAQRFSFKYRNNNYELDQALSPTLYDYYRNLPKVYTYEVGHEPSNIREAFYGLFLKPKSGDTSLDDILAKLQKVASENNWTSDQLAEFTMAFIQYIPYDYSKVSAGLNTNPFYFYETLYLDRGVCSDKTFLAVLLLRRLGYGAAILDFPDKDHTAAGIACPREYSLNNSGYCYIETTNYFPLGVIPRTLSQGQAQAGDNNFLNLFEASNLGRIEILQKTVGQVYQGVSLTRAKVAELSAAKDDLNARQAEMTNLNSVLTAQEANITTMKAQLDNYYSHGQLSNYNNLVPTYNTLVNQYNDGLAAYRTKVEEYNQKVVDFNQAGKDFYQN